MVIPLYAPSSLIPHSPIQYVNLKPESFIQFAAPQFPDYRGNFVKTVVEPCEAAGGHLEGYECVTPPPPPVPVYVAPIPVYVAPVAPVTDHASLMAAAGIAPSDYPAVEFIVSMESGWNPNATNAYSGAHGLPQALPYSKTGCGWSDAVCQLRWASSYAQTRYGGWWPAYNAWIAQRWW